jgi:hypothetical protein
MFSAAYQAGLHQYPCLQLSRTRSKEIDWKPSEARCQLVQILSFCFPRGFPLRNHIEIWNTEEEGSEKDETQKGVV